MTSFYPALRPLLFQLDAETAHTIALQALRAVQHTPALLRMLTRMFAFEDSRLHTEVCGLRFRNPVGIAAGYDKNAVCVPGLAALGAGHVEVGTLTPLAQRGNARPRVFRLAQDAALINRLGFPNAGMAAVLPRLAALRARGLRAPLGINIGKGRDTPLELALVDYSTLLQQVHPFADYIAINISSPNTPGLRTLQSGTALAPLLGALQLLRQQHCPRLPLLVKIAPDLSPSQLDELLDAALTHTIDGVLATNTTTARPNLRSPATGAEGGLSGVPLQPASNAVIRHIRKHSGSKLAIIGVGGIDCAAAALEKLRAGANLLQVYTGLVYQGPGLLHAINRGLVQTLAQCGAHSLAELVAV